MWEIGWGPPAWHEFVSSSWGGDFEPIVTEDLFQRAQAVLSGRLPSTAPRLQAHPAFPLRNFVRCASCNRGLTGSWSKGLSEYYAYYHRRPGCRGVNVTRSVEVSPRERAPRAGFQVTLEA